MMTQDDRVAKAQAHDDDGVAGRATTVPPGGLTVARRNRFLDTLAEACNVSVAAAAAGASISAFHALRRRDPLFAEQWVAALTIGYEALEASLVDYAMGRETADAAAWCDDAGRGGRPRPLRQPGAGLSPDADGVPPRIQVGLLLLGRHRAAIDGDRPMRQGRRVVTAAETDAVLNKRLDLLARSIRAKSIGDKSIGDKPVGDKPVGDKSIGARG